MHQYVTARCVHPLAGTVEVPSDKACAGRGLVTCDSGRSEIVEGVDTE